MNRVCSKSEYVFTFRSEFSSEWWLECFLKGIENCKIGFSSRFNPDVTRLALHRVADILLYSYGNVLCRLSDEIATTCHAWKTCSHFKLSVPHLTLYLCTCFSYICFCYKKKMWYFCARVQPCIFHNIYYQLNFSSVYWRMDIMLVNSR